MTNKLNNYLKQSVWRVYRLPAVLFNLSINEFKQNPKHTMWQLTLAMKLVG